MVAVLNEHIVYINEPVHEMIHASSIKQVRNYCLCDWNLHIS